ncbi:MAG: aminoglycoside 6-adenylyltransferase [Candidatus Cloacimonetes bacterium]|nr:aminoglycoside 6-adenylyltransferase [Candidatus Cloacimonadota bacterium]
MKNRKSIIATVRTWAQNEPKIKVVILEGSGCTSHIKDEFSDHDLNLFVADATEYLAYEDWLKQFDDILVFQKEGFFYQNTFIPTRLVIYQNSPRVDFSFWPVSLLEDWIEKQELPEFYKNGFSVIVDKLNITNKLLPPMNDGFIIDKPTKERFLLNIYNFYFEAAIIAKYLLRKNLWFALKLSNGPIKNYLQQMIMWQISSRNNWNLKGMNNLGKNLEEKISASTAAKLNNCFSEYDLRSCWKNLVSMMNIFDEISKAISLQIGIKFPAERIEKIKQYINEIRSRSKN